MAILTHFSKGSHRNISLLLFWFMRLGSDGTHSMCLMLLHGSEHFSSQCWQFLLSFVSTFSCVVSCGHVTMGFAQCTVRLAKYLKWRKALAVTAVFSLHKLVWWCTVLVAPNYDCCVFIVLVGIMMYSSSRPRLWLLCFHCTCYCDNVLFQ